MSTNPENVEISDLLEASERVEFERGNIKLWHEAFLERISAQNPAYVKLVRVGADLERKATLVRNKADYFADEAWLQGEMQSPIKESSEESGDMWRMPTLLEIEARQKELEKQAEKLGKELDKAQAALLANKAERVVYLTKNWALTDKGQTVKCDVPNVLKFYSEPLLELALSSIEGRVFGLFTTTQRASSV